MINLVCLGHRFFYEMEHICRMFFPGAKIKALEQVPGDLEPLVLTTLDQRAGGTLPTVRLDLPEGALERTGEPLPPDAPKEEAERLLGVLLYQSLSALTGVSPPWGILTGVRPVRLCRQWREQGLSEDQARQRFVRDYLVRPEKAELALQTARIQEPSLSAAGPLDYSLYISIPFCPTRCLYCSFVSHAIDKARKLVPDYLDLLHRELRETARIARERGLILRTVYMGGGTPTSLEAEQLAAILHTVEEAFDLSHLREYTVEAGRPDTLSAEKLAVLKKFGVGRISINPQTMDDTILKAIGRKHTARQVEERFALARDRGFDSINMDLIAGLPGQDGESLGETLDAVLRMRPENITLHTLTVKRSSGLRERPDAFAGSPLALDALLSQAQSRFAGQGYHPYYLYRQKGTVQNLENTGFSLPGQEGLYNIYSMEEMHTILAVGAGAVTKLCHGQTISRVCNFKYPYEYIARFDELLGRKSTVGEFYENIFGEKIHTG